MMWKRMFFVQAAYPSDQTALQYTYSYPSAPKKLNNKVVKIDYVANFIFPRGEYQDVAVVDDGKSVTIYFGDELVAKISFSERRSMISAMRILFKGNCYWKKWLRSCQCGQCVN